MKFAKFVYFVKIRKTTVYINKSNQLFFAMFIKFCDESGLAILS